MAHFFVKAVVQRYYSFIGELLEGFLQLDKKLIFKHSIFRSTMHNI